MTELLLDALASWRIVRLLQKDEITAHARHNLIGWTLDKKHPQIRYLISCPHCLSVWSSAFVLLLRRAPFGHVLRDLLAVAGLVSVWAEVEDKATRAD